MKRMRRLIVNILHDKIMYSKEFLSTLNVLCKYGSKQ